MANIKTKPTNQRKLNTKSKIWRVALCIVVPLIVGGISAALTMNAMTSFGAMKQPPLAPPAWLFPVAWTILYILMGIASWLIWYAGISTKVGKSQATTIRRLLVIYGVQLVFNFCWTPMFFNFKWYWFAFVWLIAMWIMILVLIIGTRKISRGALFCLLPYLIWCTFAAYLNIGIAILN